MSHSESSNGNAHGANILAPGPPPAPAPAGLGKKILATVVILYCVSILLLWAWMMWDGDRQWMATVILFGPRWLCGLPLPLLALTAAVWHRRLLWILAATAVVLIGPFMGFKANLFASDTAPPVLRVLTCNIAQNAFDKWSFAEVVVNEQPDVVALQECAYGTEFIWPSGWHVLARDEFVVASRWPIKEEQNLRRPSMPNKVAAIRYQVQLPDRRIHLINLHLETPRSGLEAVLNRPTEGAPKLEAILELRSAESLAVSDWVARVYGPKIVLGDFNMPGESTIFRRDWTSMGDAFASTGWGFGFTKFSGKGALTYGARIDHVLTSDEWHCLRSWVGESVGSDHLPLLAEFE